MRSYLFDWLIASVLSTSPKRTTAIKTNLLCCFWCWCCWLFCFVSFTAMLLLEHSTKVFYIEFVLWLLSGFLFSIFMSGVFKLEAFAHTQTHEQPTNIQFIYEVIGLVLRPACVFHVSECDNLVFAVQCQTSTDGWSTKWMIACRGCGVLLTFLPSFVFSV